MEIFCIDLQRSGYHRSLPDLVAVIPLVKGYVVAGACWITSWMTVDRLCCNKEPGQANLLLAKKRRWVLLDVD
jgi:hypothetical protein